MNWGLIGIIAFCVFVLVGLSSINRSIQESNRLKQEEMDERRDKEYEKERAWLEDDEDDI